MQHVSRAIDVFAYVQFVLESSTRCGAFGEIPEEPHVKKSEAQEAAEAPAVTKKKRRYVEGDDADDVYRHPPFKVLHTREGELKTVPWCEVPCDGGERCWWKYGGWCYFLHDERSYASKVVASGTKSQCDMWRQSRRLSRERRASDENCIEARGSGGESYQ